MNLNSTAATASAPPRRRWRARWVVIAAAAIPLLGTSIAGAAVSGSSQGTLIHGCVNKSTHVLTVLKSGQHCPSGTTAISWNQTGPVGPQGTEGREGPPGANGTSLITSAGVPTGGCDKGDTDVDLANGEVYTCQGRRYPYAWTDTGDSIDGSGGQSGTSLVTSDDAPDGDCNNGDTDIDLTNGEVYTCVSGSWNDTDHTIDGSNGAPGSAGANGTSLITSDDAPDGDCNNGDTDIDLTNGEVYTCVSGSWNDTDHTIYGSNGAPGSAGTNGTNGTSVVTSAGVPDGDCTTGDTDIDLANGEVYSCESSSWTDTTNSIKWSAASSVTTVVAKSSANGTTATAYCPTGDTAIGGGASGSGTTSLAASFPANSGGGKLTASGQLPVAWTVLYAAAVGMAYTVGAYVICSP